MSSSKEPLAEFLDVSGLLSNQHLLEGCQEDITWNVRYCVLSTKDRMLYVYQSEQDSCSAESQPSSSHPEGGNGSSNRGGSIRPRAESATSGSNAGKSGKLEVWMRKLSLKSRRSVTASSISNNNNNNNTTTSSTSHNSADRGRSEKAADISTRGLFEAVVLNEGEVVLRYVHPSLANGTHAFLVTSPKGSRYFGCSSADEVHWWISRVQEVVGPDQDLSARCFSSLELCIQEAKNLPMVKWYSFHVNINGYTYAVTKPRQPLKSPHCTQPCLLGGDDLVINNVQESDILTVSVYSLDDVQMKKKDRGLCIGKVDLQISSLVSSTDLNEWLHIHPLEGSPMPSQRKTKRSLGRPMVRVYRRYKRVSILPRSAYNQFEKYVRLNSMELCQEFGSVLKEKKVDELAQCLVKLLYGHRCVEGFLAGVISDELLQLENENLALRGNTLPTKAIDAYMKMVGKKYLREVLGDLIERIYREEPDCEVDPQRLQGLDIRRNQQCLLALVRESWNLVFTSRHEIPRTLRQIYHLVSRTLPTQDRLLKVISATFFLRFLCPSVMSPNLFGIVQEMPNWKVHRALTLVAKVLQNLVNFTGFKEEYMAFMNAFCEAESSAMKSFIGFLAEEPPACLDTPGSLHYPIDVCLELAQLSELFASNWNLLTEGSCKKLSDLRQVLEGLGCFEECTPCSRLSFNDKRQSRISRSMSFTVGCSVSPSLNLSSTYPETRRAGSGDFVAVEAGDIDIALVQSLSPSHNSSPLSPPRLPLENKGPIHKANSLLMLTGRASTKPKDGIEAVKSSPSRSLSPMSQLVLSSLDLGPSDCSFNSTRWDRVNLTCGNTTSPRGSLENGCQTNTTCHTKIEHAEPCRIHVSAPLPVNLSRSNSAAREDKNPHWRSGHIWEDHSAESLSPSYECNCDAYPALSPLHEYLGQMMACLSDLQLAVRSESADRNRALFQITSRLGAIDDTLQHRQRELSDRLLEQDAEIHQLRSRVDMLEVENVNLHTLVARLESARSPNSDGGTA